MLPLLKSAMASAPLDFGDVWAAALRYCVHSLPHSSETGFERLLALIGEGPPPGD